MKDFLQWISNASNIVTLITALFSLFAWIQGIRIKKWLKKEEGRNNESIAIVLENGGRKYEIPLSTTRSQLTRAEVMGIIGMLPLRGGKKRFNLSITRQKEFIEKIREIKSSNINSLSISCDDEEYNQFEFEP